MPSRHPIVELPAFQGLNLKDDARRLLPFTSLTTATNVIINDDGSIQRMNGYTDILSSDLGTGKMLSYYEWTRYDASVLKIFLYGGALYRVTGAGDTKALMLSGLTDDRKWRWVPQNDYLWGGNGTDENKVITPTPHHNRPQTALDTANATDYATSYTLLNDLRATYIAHRLNGTITDNTSASITYTGAGWTASTTSTGPYKRTYKYSNVDNETASFSFTGTGVIWIGTKNTNHGYVKVYIDDVAITNGDVALTGDTGGNQSGIDCYAAAADWQNQLYTKSGLTYGSHSIKVEITNQKHASATDYYGSVDCFIVLDDTNAYHNLADTTNTVSAGYASDAASAHTLANELKTDYNAHRSQAGVHGIADSYHEITAADASSEATTYALANQLKACLNQHIQDAMVLKWGITAPTTAATAADGAVGNPNGTYLITYTYYDAVNGWESAPSTTTTDTVTSVQIVLTTMDVSTDPKVTHKRIYRTTASGAIFYYEAQIANDVVTYTCNATDTTLSGAAALQTEGQAVPPVTSIFTVLGGSIVMAGNVAATYSIYWTNPGNPLGYISATNYQWFDVNVSVLHTLPSGLLVCEYNPPKTWLMPGDTASTFGAQIVLDDHEGIPCMEAHHRDEDVILCITNFGIKKFDGTRYVDIGEMVNKEVMTRVLNDAVVCIDPKNQRAYFVVA